MAADGAEAFEYCPGLSRWISDIHFPMLAYIFANVCVCVCVCGKSLEEIFPRCTSRIDSDACFEAFAVRLKFAFYFFLWGLECVLNENVS